MSFVNGIGWTFRPVFVYPGRELHYLLVGTDSRTILDWLPHCYLYQREGVGVDSEIFMDRAKHVIKGTEQLRVAFNYLLSIWILFLPMPDMLH